ncbi:MAG: TPM domain-containing protein [Deltaproteobacteria bacterium]|nr:TPM domain-containing protein [Deltaproteobacteria bacterium]
MSRARHGRTRTALWCALASLCLGLAARADIPIPKFDGYVVDAAHVLDADSVRELRAISSKLDRTGIAQLAVVTLPTLGDETIEDAAQAIFVKWGLGHNKQRSDGVLIVFVPGPPGHKRSRIHVGYGVEGALNDGKLGNLLRTLASPLLKQDQYGPAAVALARAIDDILVADASDGTEGAPITPEPGATRAVPAARDPESLGALGWVVLFLGGTLVLLLYSASQRRFPGTPHALVFASAAAASLAALFIFGGFGGWVAFLIGIAGNAAAWSSIRARRCPKCNVGWVAITRVVLTEPTYYKSGLAVVHKRCNKCGYKEDEDELIPRKEVSTSVGYGGSGGGYDSGDSGGSWGGDSGGGDSFGGGGGGDSGGGGASSSD